MEAAFTDCSLISSAIARILSDRTWQQLRNLGISEDKLQKMQETLRRIQKFVDSVRHQFLIEKGNDKIILLLNRWRQKLNDLTFFFENSNDEYGSEILERKKLSCSKASFFKLKIFTQMNELHKLASRIDYEISKRYQDLKLDNHTRERSEDHESIMIIERKADEEKIISMLRNTMNAEAANAGAANAEAADIFTIAIVGMAGN